MLAIEPRVQAQTEPAPGAAPEATAEEEPATAAPDDPAATAAPDDPAATAAPGASVAPVEPIAPVPRRAAGPATATQALDRASAAYEFGDIQQMIELSRLVAEGALLGAEDQRADALRLLGIGLYLSGRPDGAQLVFVDLLKLRPKARLDPTVTRPEVVAFFEDVRRQNRPKKYRALTLLPPLGQFQNGDNVRAGIFLGLEIVAAGTAVTTLIMLERRHLDDLTCKGSPHDPTPCKRLKTAYYSSLGALAAVWAIGVIDALVRFDRDPDGPEEATVSFALHPRGAAMRVSF